MDSFDVLRFAMSVVPEHSRVVERLRKAIAVLAMGVMWAWGGGGSGWWSEVS